jgi:hypothetical protein
MRNLVVGLGATGAALLLLLCGCMQSAALATKAGSAEQLECTGATVSPDELRLRESMTVLKVERQVWWDWCYGIAKIEGTKLLVRPPVAMSSEQLSRNLQCASARAALGRVDPGALPNDPYGLPGAWVDIDVNPEGDNFAVTLRADSVPHNILLLRRATAFAAAQRAAARQ